jgi:uncharacterized membrane protein
LASNRPDSVPRRWVGATASLAALWIAGSLAAPLLADAAPTASTLLRAAYAPVCHQETGRSLHPAGAPAAVCARCLGLYLGGLAGLVVGATLGAWRRRVPVWVFFAVVAPTLIDASLAFAGLPSLANLPRAALAVTAGGVAGWFLAVAVGDLAGQWREWRESSLKQPIRIQGGGE